MATNATQCQASVLLECASLQVALEGERAVRRLTQALGSVKKTFSIEKLFENSCLLAKVQISYNKRTETSSFRLDSVDAGTMAMHLVLTRGFLPHFFQKTGPQEKKKIALRAQVPYKGL